MKTKILLLIILTVFGFTTFGQNEKCLKLSNNIIRNINGKILNQFADDIYTIKVEVSTNDFNVIKTICDTTAKNTKVEWRLNYDKNWEKTFIVGGKELLITFYPVDKYIYFEFPKK